MPPSARAQARKEIIRVLPSSSNVAGTGPKIKTPVGDAPIIPILLILIGGYLMWFGVKYFKKTRTDGSMLWPSDPIKSVLQGKGLPQTASSTELADFANADIGAQVASTIANNPPGSSQAPAPGGSTGAPTATATTNQAAGQLVAAAYGWSEAQNSHEWESLVKLWNQESGWNNEAMNSQSGAYGIAQALGHGNGAATQGTVTNQYGGYGISDGMAVSANSGDATAQITWGLQYIKETYGDPIAAWNHEVANNWY